MYNVTNVTASLAKKTQRKTSKYSSVNIFPFAVVNETIMTGRQMMHGLAQGTQINAMHTKLKERFVRKIYDKKTTFRSILKWNDALILYIVDAIPKGMICLCCSFYASDV